MLALLLLGCSLGTDDATPCAAAAECRDAFGFGSTCGDDGLCVPIDVPARCGETWPEDLLTRPELYPDVIVVGSLFDHSRDEGDVPESQAVRLAVKQVEDNGGLEGRDLALIQCSYEEDAALDALTSEDAGAALAAWLAEDAGAVAIVGPATSGMAEVAYASAAERGAMLISPFATSPALAALDGFTETEADPGLFWRTAPRDSLQGAALATDVIARLGAGPHTVAVVHQTGPYGEGLAEVFAEAFEGAGHDAQLRPFENDTQRDDAVIGVGQEGGVDAVLFISSDLPDVSAFLLAAYPIPAYGALPIWLADAARDTQLLTETVEAAMLWDQVRGTAPAVPSGLVYEAFAAAYSASYEGEEASDSSYTAYAYDAAWLVAYGAAWARYTEGDVTGVGVSRGLRHVSSGPEIEIKPVNWSSVLQHWQSGGGIDVEGASGHLDFNPETGEPSGPIDIWTISPQGDGFLTVETIEP